MLDDAIYKLNRALAVLADQQWEVDSLIDKIKEIPLTPYHKTHISWEAVHIANSYEELIRDIKRLINTIQDKDLNAGTKI